LKVRKSSRAYASCWVRFAIHVLLVIECMSGCVSYMQEVCPRTYLAHHELESITIIIIIVIVIIIVVINAGTEGWAREEDVDPSLELLRKYSMMVYTQADQKQKRFKLSAMPCLGVAFVGDVLM